MAKAPGYQKRPDHRISETPQPGRVRVEIGGELVADSGNVLRVDEDRHPVRYYFPRADVSMEKLQRTTTITTCPFKGSANYFSISAGGKTLADAVWSYEAPYDEHRGLKDLLAFYDDKYPDIRVTPGP